ncbi:MAG TPA: DciA family protein [Vicinamibacterales bacterium]|nr:DciA family protein [Vicinamibacterales bacterium]
MRPIQTFSGGVLADILRRQPPSAGRTALAWQLAVGPVLARATSIEMDGTTLVVRAHDPRWLKEIERARPAILQKLQHLLGASHISSLTTR